MAGKEDGGGIQVIARAAALLRALQNERSGLTLSQLAQLTGLPRSTVQRIAGALTDEGLLAPATRSGGVVLGAGIVALAGAVQPPFADFARPYLRDLSDRTGETVDLAEFRGNHLLFIDQHLGSHRLCAVSGVGKLFPLHNSANGKACLALFGAAEARRIAAESWEGTPETSALDPLMGELKRARQSGLAYDWEQNAPGISAVGTAFRQRGGAIVAISVPTPADRFEANHQDIGRHLLATRARLVSALGLDAEPAIERGPALSVAS